MRKIEECGRGSSSRGAVPSCGSVANAVAEWRRRTVRHDGGGQGDASVAERHDAAEERRGATQRWCDDGGHSGASVMATSAVAARLEVN